jgi:hypothetical protein
MSIGLNKPAFNEPIIMCNICHRPINSPVLSFNCTCRKMAAPAKQ